MDNQRARDTADLIGAALTTAIGIGARTPTTREGYEWQKGPEGLFVDTPTRYFLLRDGRKIGEMSLNWDVPFQSAILNDVCELLRRYETDELA